MPSLLEQLIILLASLILFLLESHAKWRDKGMHIFLRYQQSMSKRQFFKFEYWHDCWSCVSYIDFPITIKLELIPKDQYKTAFITSWSTFCYMVMSFGLTNARAIYQRAIVTMCHDMIHHSLKVYVDDLLAKSKKKDHLQDLGQISLKLRWYKLWLKPQNSAFGVSFIKLLGFIVSPRGIKMDLKKVKAITKMVPPSNLKELRCLQGKIHALRRCISQLANRSALVTHLL